MYTLIIIEIKIRAHSYRYNITSKELEEEATKAREERARPEGAGKCGGAKQHNHSLKSHVFIAGADGYTNRSLFTD